jgi:hypothetical protein
MTMTARAFLLSKSNTAEERFEPLRRIANREKSFHDLSEAVHTMQ